MAGNDISPIAVNDLSQQMIDAGASLLHMTDELGMKVQGAMWVRDYELDEWRYYLVSSLIDTLGRKKTYKLLIQAFEKLKLPESMTIEDVYLGSPIDMLFKIISQAIAVSEAGVLIKDCIFNGTKFDGYIYRSVRELPTRDEAKRIENNFTKHVKKLA